VIDLPDSSVFADLIDDRRFVMAAAIAILSGVARGFSGFGSALIYIPLMSAVYEPRIAAASFLLADIATGFAFLLGAYRLANWREILPMVAAAIVSVQFGALILQHADPTLLRWMICILVGVLVPILASGWRYHGQPKMLVTIGVGLLAGVLGGAVQIPGPPILLYWLGSAQDPAVLRASFIGFFSIFSCGAIVTYFLHGLVTAQVIALAVLVAPMHVLAMGAGMKLFHLAPAWSYRAVAYVIIAASAIIGLPLFDRWLR
jgi:uncharacterized membrane protein YfcA